MHPDNSGHTFSRGLHIMNSLPVCNFVWTCKLVYCTAKPVPTSPDSFSFAWRNRPRGPGLPHYGGFKMTFRHTTLGRTPLGEWSARRRDFYLATHNTHKTQTSTTTPPPPAGFKPTISARERPLGSAPKFLVAENQTPNTDRPMSIVWCIHRCEGWDCELLGKNTPWSGIMVTFGRNIRLWFLDM
jgi:hypothetical protein